MISLLLVIILNVLILSIFRLLSHFLVNTYQTILINYWTCAVISLVILGNLDFVTISNLKSWIWFACILGGIFVATFYLIAQTTQKFDISVASLASKISLVLPVIFSLAILKSFSREFDWLNNLGLVLTIFSILLTGLKKDQLDYTTRYRLLVLPLSVFLLTGVIDSSLNYANFKLIEPSESYAFTGTLFFSAAFLGTIVFVSRKRKIEIKSVPWGILLGIVNIFSVVFILKTLDFFNNDGAFVFPIVNMGIIIFASLVSLFFFRDKTNKLKMAGLLLGIISLLFIAHQELFGT